MLKLFKRKQRETENNTAFHLEQYGCIIDVKRVECRPFYDSTWSVTVKDGDKDAETTNIVVKDTETAELMAGTVLAWYQKLRSLAEVKKNMDLRGSIYYD